MRQATLELDAEGNEVQHGPPGNPPKVGMAASAGGSSRSSSGSMPPTPVSLPHPTLCPGLLMSLGACVHSTRAWHSAC